MYRSRYGRNPNTIWIIGGVIAAIMIMIVATILVIGNGNKKAENVKLKVDQAVALCTRDEPRELSLGEVLITNAREKAQSDWQSYVASNAPSGRTVSKTLIFTDWEIQYKQICSKIAEVAHLLESSTERSEKIARYNEAAQYIKEFDKLAASQTESFRTAKAALDSANTASIRMRNAEAQVASASLLSLFDSRSVDIVTAMVRLGAAGQENEAAWSDLSRGSWNSARTHADYAARLAITAYELASTPTPIPTSTPISPTPMPIQVGVPVHDSDMSDSGWDDGPALQPTSDWGSPALQATPSDDWGLPALQATPEGN